MLPWRQRYGAQKPLAVDSLGHVGAASQQSVGIEKRETALQVWWGIEEARRESADRSHPAH